jgi:hypothetical protein
MQFEILDTVSANRRITVTGSNGGNPTLSTTAGSLAITPAVVMASALTVGANLTVASGSLSLGATPSSDGRIALTYSDQIKWKNNAGSQNLVVLSCQVQNAVHDIIIVGDGNTAGMFWKARSGGAAPTTSDLPSGFATLWRDTGGATTKLYYNNGGVMQNVALA